MTISSFCRELLLVHGPLPLDLLAEKAAEAGVTTARNPRSSVRSALVYKEVLLDDGRWATPLWLLEGRILTTEGLHLDDGWCEDDEELGSAHDLALVDAALRSSPLALASGGVLRPRSYGVEWDTPDGWPGVRPDCGELLGLRVRDGQVHVELVPLTAEVRLAGEDLAREIGPLDPRKQSWWASSDRQVSQDLTAVLWERVATDPSFLTSPVPPLSRCIPPMASALRDERARRAAERRRWRPHLDLPASVHEVAVEAARGSGAPLDAWLSTFVARALRDVDDSDGYGSGLIAEDVPELGDVVPLRRGWV